MKDLQLIVLPVGNNPVSPKFNDIEVSDYDLQTLESTARKTQDVIKILLTRIGANPVYPTYGSELPNVFGRRATPQVNDVILESIIKALGFVQVIETSPKPDERVKRIVNVYVVDGSDARTKIIRLLVELEDGSIIETSTPVKLGV